MFVEEARGESARRPELDEALLSADRVGDRLVVTKLDRLGRSLEDLIELSERLQTWWRAGGCWTTASGVEQQRNGQWR